MRSPESVPTDPDDLIRYGRVESVDHDAARVTVRFSDPEADGEAITAPVRWVAARHGNTRVWSPPSVGEEVVMLCPGGQIGNAVILGGLPNTDHPAAGNSETELVHFADGAVLSYDPQASALRIALPAGGTIRIDGDVTVSGDITATGDVTGGGISLTGHVHGGVAGGTAVSQPPQGAIGGPPA